MTNAQAALAQVREALAAGPTPGPWSLKTVPTSDGSCHKIGPFPSASRAHSETHACVYASGIRLGIDDSTPVAMELLANARLIAAGSPGRRQVPPERRSRVLRPPGEREAPQRPTDSRNSRATRLHIATL